MSDLYAESPVTRQNYWNDLWTGQEAPWQYGPDNAYETTKYLQTLSVLPEQPFTKALELACADGHFTVQLAAKVVNLIATDVSPAAVELARSRCAGLAHVDFQVLDFTIDDLPAELDLLVCMEVLYFTKRERLAGLAEKFARVIKKDGLLLMTHPFLIADDRDHSGFDWGFGFGAKTIGEIFAACRGFALVKELRTAMYSIMLFRRVGPEIGTIPAPELIEAPHAAVLPFYVERSFIWGGAVCTRAEAQSNERAIQVPILMYHSIADDRHPESSPYRVSPAMFQEQMRFLRGHGYHSISLDEWVGCVASGRDIPGRPVIITFDDGYKNVLTHAAPILEAADFRATIFVVTRKVGSHSNWDAGSPVELLDWDDLRLLQQRGFEIGSHTTSHIDLLTISDEDIVRDCVEARATFRKQLGRQVTSLALPWGRGDARVRNALYRGGFRAVLGTTGGFSNLKDDVLNLARIEIFGHDVLDTFRTRIETARIESYLRNIKNLNNELAVQKDKYDCLGAEYDRITGRYRLVLGALDKLTVQRDRSVTR